MPSMFRTKEIRSYFTLKFLDIRLARECFSPKRRLGLNFIGKPSLITSRLLLSRVNPVQSPACPQDVNFYESSTVAKRIARENIPLL